MARVVTILYKNKDLLCVDYKGLTNLAETLEVLDLLEEHLKASKGHILLFQDFNNVFLAREFMNRAKRLGKRYQKRVDKHALTGIKGIKKVLLQAYITVTGDTVRAFDTETQAKDFLVE